MRYLTYLLCALLSLVGLPARAAVGVDDVYGLVFKTLDGQPLSLSHYRGKVLLIVNVASRCGFTPQYAGLEKLYETYRDRGLVVIGIPSNDFGGQEPGNEEQIKQFTSEKYRITFPITSREIATGKQANPFFKQVSNDLGIFATPRWNFYKYLVGRDGHLVSWFASTTKPDSDKLTRAIEAELNRKPF